MIRVAWQPPCKKTGAYYSGKFPGTNFKSPGHPPHLILFWIEDILEYDLIAWFVLRNAIAGMLIIYL